MHKMSQMQLSNKAELQLILCWSSSLAWWPIYCELHLGFLFLCWWKFVTNLNFLWLLWFEWCECKVVSLIHGGNNRFSKSWWFVRFHKLCYPRITHISIAHCYLMPLVYYCFPKDWSAVKVSLLCPRLMTVRIALSQFVLNTGTIFLCMSKQVQPFLTG
jgi:hypothetical protein